jgi:transcription antitermination factor NusG
MLDLQNTPHWYALYTRSRYEKRVDEELQLKGYESYLPLQQQLRQWHDRKKKVEMPVFPGYVFVRLPLKQRLPALETQGVVTFVSTAGRPSPIHDFEISALRCVLANNVPYQRSEYLPIGEEVEVTHGPLRGVVGRLIEYRGENRLLIGIKQIGQAISVVIDRNLIKSVYKQTPLVSNENTNLRNP